MTRPDGHDEDRSGAEVVPLRSRELQPVDEPEVLDAELVDEPRTPVPVRAVRYVASHRVTRAAGKVATHPHTVTAARAAARQVSYVLAGVLLVVKRLVDARTHSFHARMLRAAEASRDWDKIAEWETRSEHARQARHGRRMDWLEAPGKLAKAAAIITGSFAVLLAVVGVIGMVGDRDPGKFLAPFLAVVDVARWVATVVAVVWGPLVLALPWVAVGLLWWVGKRAGAAPAWLQTATGADRDEVPVDESAIARALQHLGLAPLSRFFTDGGVLAYTAIPRRDGLGVAAGVRLPHGVSAAEVVARKGKLAANLGRAEVECWPSVGDEAGLLALWVADRGALDAGAGDWPLLADTRPVDVLAGIPVGKSLRGSEVVAPVDGTSWLIGGRPGQGKSNFARLLVMGAALDPTAELWCFVLADNGDYDPLADRFTRYAVGMGNEVAEAALAALVDLLGEIERRGRVMRERGAKTAAEAGFHELVVVMDECHRLFQHRDHGTEAGRLAEDLVKQARKYGLVLVLITQSPTATSIPKGVTREVTCRVAFSVVDQVGNDALLGSGKYKNGVRATELRAGSPANPGDRGKAITVGVVDGTDWAMLLACRVEDQAVVGVAQRAIAAANRRGHSPRPVAARELLDDLAAVLGTDPVPAADVPALLREHAPDWPPYRTLNGRQLRDQLARYGIKVASTGNRWPVDPAAIRRAQQDGDGDAS